MSRRLPVLGLLCALVLCACGGSSATSSSASHSTTAAVATSGSAGGGQGTSSTASSTPDSTSGAAPGAATTTPGAFTTSSRSVPGGSTQVRLPATFTVRHGGVLRPPSISSPAFLAIQLTVASGDGRPHRIMLRTPKPHRLTVPAGGRASVLIPGLRAGHYVIDVDGAGRGGLDVGGEPGP